MGIGEAFDFCGFAHHHIIKRNAASRIKQHHIITAKLRRLHGAGGNLLRLLSRNDG